MTDLKDAYADYKKESNENETPFHHSQLTLMAIRPHGMVTKMAVPSHGKISMVTRMAVPSHGKTRSDIVTFMAAPSHGKTRSDMVTYMAEPCHGKEHDDDPSMMTYMAAPCHGKTQTIMTTDMAIPLHGKTEMAGKDVKMYKTKMFSDEHGLNHSNRVNEIIDPNRARYLERNKKEEEIKKENEKWAASNKMVSKMAVPDHGKNKWFCGMFN